MPLHTYREQPSVGFLSPMNGPIYGGFPLVIEGKGFIDTGGIVIRFQLFEDQAADDPSGLAVPTPAAASTISADPKQQEDDVPASIVHAPAKFVSIERVICSAPSFQQQGVYMVSVSLNGVEFSKINATSWFLVWQNWQKRKRLLSHGLFAHPMHEEAAASIIGTPAELDVAQVQKLRHRSSFMVARTAKERQQADSGLKLPLIHGKNAQSIIETVDEALEEDEFVDPRLLIWHPAASSDEQNEPLIRLLDSLCNAPATQSIMARRIRIVFRLKGLLMARRERDVTDQDDEDSDELVLPFAAFVKGLRLIFPNASSQELDDLWTVLDRAQRGYVTYESVMNRMIRPPRSSSPEPGPTHYDPQYKLVLPKPSSAIILPESEQPELITGQPSELFMNYESFNVVKPRAVGAVFPKRSFTASWCNPVPSEIDLVATATGDGDQTSTARSMKTPRPPPGARLPQHQVATAGGALKSAGKSVTTGSTSEVEERSGSGDKPKDDQPRTPRDTASTSSMLSVRRKEATTRASREPHSNGRNVFYSDIAPLYLKFLNSKEVQRAMKQ